jgi:hypothetical protein
MSAAYLSLLATMTLPPQPPRPPPDAPPEVLAQWEEDIGAWEQDRQSRDLQNKTAEDEERARAERASALRRLEVAGLICDFFKPMRSSSSSPGAAGAGTPSDLGSSLMRRESFRDLIDYLDAHTSMVDGSVLFSTVLRRGGGALASWGLKLTPCDNAGYVLVESISEEASLGSIDLGHWAAQNGADSSTGVARGSALPWGELAAAAHLPWVPAPPAPPRPTVGGSTWLQSAAASSASRTAAVGTGRGGPARGGKRSRFEAAAGSASASRAPSLTATVALPQVSWKLRAGDHILTSTPDAFADMAKLHSSDLVIRVRRLTPEGRLVQESYSRGGCQSGGPLPRPLWMDDKAPVAAVRASVVALLKVEKMALNAKFLKFSRPWAVNKAALLEEQLMAAITQGEIEQWAAEALKEAERIRTAIALTPKGKRVPGEQIAVGGARARPHEAHVIKPSPPTSTQMSFERGCRLYPKRSPIAT